TGIVTKTHIHPALFAITHSLTLGWGTMMIFGASYQLLPVLIEGELKSDLLGYLSFIFAATGIPLLIVGFYFFFTTPIVMQIAAIRINSAIIFYLVNVVSSALASKNINVHAWFIICGTLWLFSTTIFGLLLVFNFGENSILPKDSYSYLSIHAHIGIIGW